MENFVAYNPTKVFFGENALDIYGEHIAEIGKKALIVTGKKSAKKYGYFDTVSKKLTSLDIDFVEFSGIKPNPSVEDVREAVKICQKETIDFIIALGGGSVIDSAKIIAASFANNADAWEIMKGNVELTKKLPIVTILTFAGTGSEMNSAAVLQNEAEKLKIGFADSTLFPVLSYLDPKFTLTIPKNQTIYGIADLLAHSFEAYFADGEASLSDRFVAALYNEIDEVAPLLLQDLENYQYRARVMWAATVALNGTMYYGRKASGDWGVHQLGHVLSYLFDTPHGATLSLIYPAWLKMMKTKIEDRIANLGKLITGVDTSADETIEMIENFFKKIQAPTKWSDVELCSSDADIIKKLWIESNANGIFHKMNVEDYELILKNIE